jgi:hypothetical protein
MTATVEIAPVHYSNGFRYTTAPRWFDFYNCRVLLPEQRLYFFTMPFVLSGTELPPGAGGLLVYDGGNGGPSPGSRCAWERIGTGWTASPDRCDVRWRRDGAEQEFGERRIRVTGPTSQWDVTIEPFLADQQPEETNPRRLELGEQLLLSRVPFVHRVPRMRAYATGTIVQEGRRHSFQRAIVYQAKNHGHGFPDEWIWIHCGAFREDPALAIEAGWMRYAENGSAALIRISTALGVRFLMSWNGDDVDVRRDGDAYSFRGVSRDGALEIDGTGTHGDPVAFSFPAPDGGRFDNDECLTGELSVTLAGRRLTTNMAALASARRLPAPAGEGFYR